MVLEQILGRIKTLEVRCAMDGTVNAYSGVELLNLACQLVSAVDGADAGKMGVIRGCKCKNCIYLIDDDFDEDEEDDITLNRKTCCHPESPINEVYTIPDDFGCIYGEY